MIYNFEFRAADKEAATIAFAAMIDAEAAEQPGYDSLVAEAKAMFADRLVKLAPVRVSADADPVPIEDVFVRATGSFIARIGGDGTADCISQSLEISNVLKT